MDGTEYVLQVFPFCCICFILFVVYIDICGGQRSRDTGIPQELPILFFEMEVLANWPGSQGGTHLSLPPLLLLSECTSGASMELRSSRSQGKHFVNQSLLQAFEMEK